MNSARQTNVRRIGGAFLIVISVLLLIIAAQGLRYANYQSSGVTTQATVTAKDTVRTRQVSGSQLYRSDYLLDVTFSTGPAAAAQSSAPGKFITAAALVDDQHAAGLKQGDRVSVIYLPDDPQNTVVVQAALDAGTVGLAADQVERYRQSGVTVEATVDQIDTTQPALRVMFMTRLTSANAGHQVAATLDVNKSTWDAVEPGSSIEVVYLPDDPATNVVARRTLEEGGVNPFLMLGLAAVALLSGIFLLWKYRAPRRSA
jgi:hypothetical protein